MSLKNFVIIICTVLLIAMIAGCTSSTSSTDPIVGTWKQNLSLIGITMDLKADGTGTMTLDMSALVSSTSSGPAVKSMDIKWKQVNSTFINIYNASDMSTEFALLNYDKTNNHLWDPTGNSQLDLYKV